LAIEDNLVTVSGNTQIAIWLVSAITDASFNISFKARSDAMKLSAYPVYLRANKLMDTKQIRHPFNK
jgi:hypothetical protein